MFQYSEGSLSSTAIATLTTQQSAIRMLAERMQIAKDYLTSVRTGALPRDHETLRTIKSVLASMPAMNTQEFRDEFLKVGVITVSMADECIADMSFILLVLARNTTT